MAIVWATKKYEPYLYGNKFTLLTNHKPLVYINNSRKNAKFIRWSDQLTKFNFEIKYKEGKTNKVADALSRMVNINSTEEDDTAHSADTSDDHFVHFTERPINSFKNQLIFRVANFDTTITDTPFTNFRRVTVVRDSFSEESDQDTPRIQW